MMMWQDDKHSLETEGKGAAGGTNTSNLIRSSSLQECEPRGRGEERGVVVVGIRRQQQTR